MILTARCPAVAANWLPASAVGPWCSTVSTGNKICNVGLGPPGNSKWALDAGNTANAVDDRD